MILIEITEWSLIPRLAAFIVPTYIYILFIAIREEIKIWKSKQKSAQKSLVKSQLIS